MSAQATMKINCPKCGREENFVCVKSVNADEDPELAERVQSLDVFKFKCPGCGEELTVKYPLLYVAPSKGFAVFFDAGTAVPEAVPVTGLRLRLVSDFTELREKLRVLSAGLNDVVIEGIKNNIEGRLGKGRTVYVGREKQHLVFMSVKTGEFMRIPVLTYAGLVSLAEDTVENGFMRVNADFVR